MSKPLFNHVSVTCADFDRSMAFYHELLGLPIIEQGEVSRSPIHNAVIGLGEVRLRFAELDLSDGAGVFLELFEYLEPRGEAVASRTCDFGNVHFAVTVDDIEATWRRLDEAGVPTRSKPVEVTSGEWAGAKAFYSLDPDGVTVEFIQFPEGRE
jgi:catechol 2,3-dioxygenase-like lactoylglutathione lyase family enzyme